MRIEQLEYLVAVSKNPSINAASEKLNISHQSLNRSLKALENEFNTTLLNRTPSGITLTPHGKKVVKTAENILNQLEELQLSIANDIAVSSDTLKGNLTIVSTPQTTSSILTPILCNFKKQYPKVNYTITETMPSNVIKAIESGDCDFGIGNFSSQTLKQLDTNKITYQSLYDEKVCAIVHYSSPLAKYKSISVKTLLKYPIIVYGSAKDNMVTNILQTFGSTNNCSYTNSSHFFYESIFNGRFSGLLSASLYREIDPSIASQLVQIPLKENIYNRIALLYSNNRPLDLPVMEIIKYIATQTHLTS